MIFMDMRIFENRNNCSFSVWKHPTLRISQVFAAQSPFCRKSESQLCSFLGRIPQFLVKIPFLGYINLAVCIMIIMGLDQHLGKRTDRTHTKSTWSSWVDGHGPPRFFRVVGFGNVKGWGVHPLVRVDNQWSSQFPMKRSNKMCYSIVTNESSLPIFCRPKSEFVDRIHSNTRPGLLWGFNINGKGLHPHFKKG